MRIFWSGPAKRQRKSIALYIAERDVSAALDILELFTKSARQISQFPYVGRLGRVEGTREFVVHPHYLLVYEVLDNKINILSVLHTSQQYPPQ